jgi:uncharacterized membrane protein
MSSPKQIFDETYLTLRSKLIDIAANLDRIDRAADHESLDDPRRGKIDQAIQILASAHGDDDRAKQLQQLFSRPYDSKWRRDFGL